MILRLLTTCLILQGSCLLADDWIYTVRPGDNLWNLAEQHLISFKYVKQLQQLNGVQNPYHLPPGKNSYSTGVDHPTICQRVLSVFMAK